MNVLLDASVGTDQCKDKFYQRIEEHYLKLVKITKALLVIIEAQYPREMEDHLSWPERVVVAF
jgi:thymidylate kinase